MTDLSLIPEAAWAEAQRRSDVVRPLAARDRQPRHLVRAAAASLGLSERQTHTLLRRCRETDGALTALLPGRSGGGRGGTRIAAESEAAHPEAEPVHRRAPPARRPLDLVQIDHTPADLILVDPTDREPIGCPWLARGEVDEAALFAAVEEMRATEREAARLTRSARRAWPAPPAVPQAAPAGNDARLRMSLQNKDLLAGVVWDRTPAVAGGLAYGRQVRIG